MRYVVIVTAPETKKDSVAEVLFALGNTLTLLGDAWLVGSSALTAHELHSQLRERLGDAVPWIAVARVGEVVSDIPQTIPVSKWLAANPM